MLVSNLDTRAAGSGLGYRDYIGLNAQLLIIPPPLEKMKCKIDHDRIQTQDEKTDEIIDYKIMKVLFKELQKQNRKL